MTDHAISIASTIIKAFKEGHFLYLIGNGGSATFASHMATEFTGKFKHTRKALPAIALTTESSFITAYGNDYIQGFNQIFSRQLQAFGRPGDVLVVFSTSGKSTNCLLGIAQAKTLGMEIIDFPRDQGSNTAEIQEYQFKLMHRVCELVEEAFV